MQFVKLTDQISNPFRQKIQIWTDPSEQEIPNLIYNDGSELQIQAWKTTVLKKPGPKIVWEKKPEMVMRQMHIDKQGLYDWWNGKERERMGHTKR